MKYAAYRLVSNDLPGTLAAEVTKAMASGWQPYSAPGYSGTTGWYQAMVRYEERGTGGKQLEDKGAIKVPRSDFYPRNHRAGTESVERELSSLADLEPAAV